MNKKKSVKLRKMAVIIAAKMNPQPDVDHVYKNLKKIYHKSPNDKR